MIFMIDFLRTYYSADSGTGLTPIAHLRHSIVFLIPNPYTVNIKEKGKRIAIQSGLPGVL